MTVRTVAPALVTLSDIAALAHVQRPVVSMWRTRSAGSAHPFPATTQRLNGRDAFLLEDVVAWLEATGRGNNPAVRQESAAATALDVLPEAERLRAVDGLLALLALKAQLGTSLSGLGAEDLVDLADDVDPHDRSLHQEIAQLGADAPVWARHADALASAAFTPAAAITALLSRLHRLGLDDVSAHALDPAALALLARLAVELSPAGVDTPTFVAPDGDADLLTAVAALRGEPATAALPPLDDPATRRARRTLLANGWDLVDTAGTTAWSSHPRDRPSCCTCRRPRGRTSPTRRSPTRSAHWRRPCPPTRGRSWSGPPACCAGDCPAHSSPRAPLSCDPVGSVRSCACLPVSGPRAHARGSACGSSGPAPATCAPPATAPPSPICEPPALDPAAIHDLVTDVVAAADPSLDPLAHAFRFARFTTTTTLIATSADLVTAHPATRRPRTDPAALTLEVSALYGQAAASLPGLAPQAVRPGEAVRADVASPWVASSSSGTCA